MTNQIFFFMKSRHCRSAIRFVDRMFES